VRADASGAQQAENLCHFILRSGAFIIGCGAGGADAEQFQFPYRDRPRSSEMTAGDDNGCAARSWSTTP
jgi:hypothetical protein